MTGRWANMRDAAAQLGVTTRTLRRYVERDGLELRLGVIDVTHAAQIRDTNHARMMAGRRAPARPTLESIAAEFLASITATAEQTKLIHAFIADVRRADQRRAQGVAIADHPCDEVRQPDPIAKGTQKRVPFARGHARSTYPR